MPGERRTDLEMAKDDVTISELYLEGKTQGEIAKAIGKSQPTVSRAIQRIHERWLNDPIVNFNEAKMREIAAIDRVEAAAWEAWQMSLSDREETRTEGGRTTASKAMKRKVTQSGDASHLNVILKCSRQRADLLGLIVERSEIVPKGGSSGIDSHAGILRVIGAKERVG